MFRRLQPGRYFHFGKRFEVRNAGIAPPSGFFFLYRQVHAYLMMPFLINIGPDAVPFLPQQAGFRCSLMVLQAEFFPKGAAGGERLIPGHVMKPKEEFVRALVRIGQLALEARMILQ